MPGSTTLQTRSEELACEKKRRRKEKRTCRLAKGHPLFLSTDLKKMGKRYREKGKRKGQRKEEKRKKERKKGKKREPDGHGLNSSPDLVVLNLD